MINFLPISDHATFEIIVKVVNLSDKPISGRIFLTFPEYISYTPFRKDVKLENFEEERNIRNKIILKKPSDNSNFLASLGEIKFHFKGKTLVRRNLPAIKFVEIDETVIDFMNILLVLNGKSSYINYRTDFSEGSTT